MLDLNLQKAIQHEIAAKMIAVLPEEQKLALLAEGLAEVLKELKFDWEIKDLLKAEALAYAKKYVEQPEVQEKLRLKAKEAVDKIIDGVLFAMVETIEEGIKSKYKRLYKVG